MSPSSPTTLFYTDQQEPAASRNESRKMFPTLWITNIRGLEQNFQPLLLRLSLARTRPKILIMNETFINPSFADESLF